MSIEIPWTEKYRPQAFNEIVSQSIAINNLRDFIKNPDMPHMIFAGPAGTGKTSTALIIVKNFLKKEELSTIIDLLSLFGKYYSTLVTSFSKTFQKGNSNF